MQTRPEDLINALIGTRENVLTQLTIAIAEGNALRRELADRDRQIAELKTRIEETEARPDSAAPS